MAAVKAVTPGLPCVVLDGGADAGELIAAGAAAVLRQPVSLGELALALALTGPADAGCRATLNVMEGTVLASIPPPHPGTG